VIIQDKTDRYQHNSPDLSPKILRTVICDSEESHKETYRTNIGAEHYGCAEEKKKTLNKLSEKPNEKPIRLIKEEKHLTSKVRSQNNRSNGSRRVLTGIGTYLTSKNSTTSVSTGKINRAVGNH
jgi:hypothetical protein